MSTVIVVLILVVSVALLILASLILAGVIPVASQNPTPSSTPANTVTISSSPPVTSVGVTEIGDGVVIVNTNGMGMGSTLEKGELNSESEEKGYGCACGSVKVKLEREPRTINADINTVVIQNTNEMQVMNEATEGTVTEIEELDEEAVGMAEAPTKIDQVPNVEEIDSIVHEKEQSSGKWAKKNKRRRAKKASQ